MQDQSGRGYEISVGVLDLAFAQDFLALIERFGLSHDRGYYEQCLERQQKAEMLIVVARCGREDCGYALLNWQPKYPYFKVCGLPEIQDLNVLREYRKRGVGAKIIGFCEEAARQKGHEEMGIGVGLDSSFGAAQRLYARLGYIPDGAGITYDRKQVAAGEFRPIDENLCLMMSKKII